MSKHIKIGDPKMDSGALEEGEDLEDDFDVSQALPPEEVIWIIDQLIYREVSWQQGYPLSQTLFTSIHLDKILWPDPKSIHAPHFLRSSDPDLAPSLSQELLRAYCLGVVKCVDLVMSMVTSQHYYEVSVLHGRQPPSNAHRKRTLQLRSSTEKCYGASRLTRYWR